MTTATRLAAYGLGLLVVFGATVGLGMVVGPVAGPATAHSVPGTSPRGPASHGEHRPLGDPPLGGPPLSDPPGGLQTAQDGYRLAPVTTVLNADATTDFVFRVVGPNGAPVTHYTPTHDRDLHLIVVRRDLSNFQHVHPILQGDATAADGLERLTFRIHAFAFPIWTFAIICGAIWAEAAWGRYWGWDPKETWSFIAWVTYAGYLHARATPSVKRPIATWIAVVGWAVMMVNLFGVNLVIAGLHSYAGVKYRVPIHGAISMGSASHRRRGNARRLPADASTPDAPAGQVGARDLALIHGTHRASPVSPA